jgi:hypothetical protein
MASNKGIPESDEDCKIFPKENYFEFHIKLDLGDKDPELSNVRTTLQQSTDSISQTLLETLNIICKKHNAHLSRSGLKHATKHVRFVTLRYYSIGKNTAFERLGKCIGDLEQFKFKIDSVQREYAVFDSNVNLDSGWIEKASPEPTY